MSRNFLIIIVVSVFLFIILILGAIFLFWPKYQELSSLKIELEKKKVELKQKEEYFASLNALREKLVDYEEELVKVDSALPSNPSTPVLFYNIQQIARENGLILKSISLKEAPASSETGGVQDMSLSLGVSGSYIAFKNLLSAIYRSARLMEVESISFSSSEGGKKDLFEFSVSLKMRIYQKAIKTISGPFIKQQ